MSKITPYDEYLNEAASAKDLKRIEDIIKKANGDSEKEKSLSVRMTNTIKNKEKGKNRYLAAVQLLGKDHPVTNIFAKKARELGFNVTVKSDITPDIKTVTKFVYEETVATDVWSRYLEIVAKLRGRNWGDSFRRKLEKQFNDSEKLHLAIKRRVYDKNGGGSYGSYDRRRYPKIRDATIPGREYFFRSLLKMFDMGDAKTNKSNPAHILFTEQRVADEKEKRFNELREKAKEAWEANKSKKTLFEPGQTYIRYGSQRDGGGGRRRRGPNGVIKFTDPWALFFWNENMIGQMSDGYWENSRKYEGEWRFWSTLVPTFDPKVDLRVDDKDKYRFQDMMNPLLVRQYAVQSDGEYQTVGKIINIPDSKLLPLVEYGKSYSMQEIGSIEAAEKIANNYSIDLELFLAFLFAPVASKGEVNKVVSNAHKNMRLAMTMHF